MAVSITESPVVLRRGRELVSPGLFERLGVFCSEEYAAWCQEQFGAFVHHAPNSRVRTRPLMASVADRIAAAGFAVDARLWGAAADCNQPACCGDGDGC